MFFDFFIQQEAPKLTVSEGINRQKAHDTYHDSYGTGKEKQLPKDTRKQKVENVIRPHRREVFLFVFPFCHSLLLSAMEYIVAVKR